MTCVIHQSARLVVISPDWRVLLFRYPDGPRTFWATPGGGLEPGETFEQAAAREAEEELTPRPVRLTHLWWQQVTFTFRGEAREQLESYFLARLSPSDVVRDEDRRAAHRRDGILDSRWWWIDGIERSSEPVFPVQFAARLRSLAVPGIEVRQSPIEGAGIFATRRFGPGDRVAPIRIVREITDDDPLRADVGERVEHCAYPDGRVVLVAYPERYVNHSCDPNTWERFAGSASELVARREIAEGAEITIDYNVNTANGTAWPCHCAAARCRGIVAGDFFLLPREWQLEYRPLLAEWFIARHRPDLDSP